MQGNIKSKDIVQSLLRCLEGEAAIPGTVRKARPVTSAQALACADTTDSIADSSCRSDHSKGFNAVLDEAAEQPNALQRTTHGGAPASDSHVEKLGMEADNLDDLHQADSVTDDQEAAAITDFQPESHAVACIDTVKPEMAHTSLSIAAEPKAPESAPHADSQADVADCIGNPLYEEPDILRPVPQTTSGSATQLAFQTGDGEAAALQPEIHRGSLTEEGNKLAAASTAIDLPEGKQTY